MSGYFYQIHYIHGHQAFCVLNTDNKLVWLGFISDSNSIDKMLLEAARDLKLGGDLLVQDYFFDGASFIKNLDKKLMNNELFAEEFTLKGTEFQIAVWSELLKIKYGETKSYSDIALAIGKPDAVRAVGTAVGANPVSYFVPCHRVIGKSGKVTTGYRWGTDIKEALLAKECAI